MNRKKRESMCTGRLGRALLSAAVSAGQVLCGAQPDETNLHDVRRVCVEKLVGVTPLADAAREMAFAALYSAKRFTVLEKCDSAQATLKGAIMESADRQHRSESEGIGFGAIVGAANSTGAAVGGAGGSNGESLSSSEVKRYASVTLRLVTPEGVVIWANTQDSNGGKTKGPAADAIERAIRQLVKDSVATAETKAGK